MLNKTIIENLINEHLSGSDKFLVECNLKPSNLIMVFIDSDSKILIDDCIQLSRYVEHKLNRDDEDFELNVSSAGLDQPFKLIRQYKKNIGKAVDVKLKTGLKHTGILLNANENQIELQAFPEKKKSKTPLHNLIIPFEEINETKIKIIFTSSE
ncbi:MAG: ribosome assembly cofactor RimP [Bacteroidota bacterium]